MDITSLIVGLTASIMKGLKKRLKLRTLIIAGISGGLLSYGSIGLLEMFLDKFDERTVILCSFIVGWIANEITEILDDFVKDFYDILIQKIKEKIKK